MTAARNSAQPRAIWSANCSRVLAVRATPIAAKTVGERPAHGEVVERRHQLAAREVAARAEHHQRARRRLRAAARAAPAGRPSRCAQWPRLDFSFTAWPPNSGAQRGQHASRERVRSVASGTGDITAIAQRFARARRDRAPPARSSGLRPSRPTHPRMSSSPGSFSNAQLRQLEQPRAHHAAAVPQRGEGSRGRSRSRWPAAARSLPRTTASCRTSIPLWTILAKCPAPDGPTCFHPLGGASVSSAGARLRHRRRVAAEHEAVAHLEAPDAPRRAGVDEGDAARWSSRSWRRRESL